MFLLTVGWLTTPPGGGSGVGIHGQTRECAETKDAAPDFGQRSHDYLYPTSFSNFRSSDNLLPEHLEYRSETSWYGRILTDNCDRKPRILRLLPAMQLITFVAAHLLFTLMALDCLSVAIPQGRFRA